ncbi:hypothetical protein [uncultured Chryseobacterium sp.]|jgi:hypothetical protein|uniref:hypothetical protein n=2 Tax=Chryseobacterium group TaxID=2782232 RepID=UPI00258921DD|nr:hypothetical protein [uncultured Chryseobacterium sp.]
MRGDLGSMRTSDMTLNELLVAFNRLSMVQKITMDLSEFCEVTGKGQKEVYALLRCQYYPDELIIGGYEGRKRKKKLLFDTQKVLEWMRR